MSQEENWGTLKNEWGVLYFKSAFIICQCSKSKIYLFSDYIISFSVFMLVSLA